MSELREIQIPSTLKAALSHLASSPEGRAWLLRLVFSEEETEALLVSSEGVEVTADSIEFSSSFIEALKSARAALEQEGKE